MIAVASTTVDLARLQFATTSIYHFLFVPLTLGLAPLVAIMQTIWHRTHDDAWLRLTRFFGTLLLINFAIGVATGLVQEFEFGMNWSAYSNFVGGVFGAPLAMEGLAAFMLEATFLGLWIFGWGQLPPRVHLATIWIATAATWLSAYLILVANSWMQHPVGYTITNGAAHLTNLGALLSNEFALIAYLHTILAGLIFGSIVMLGVSCWHLLRGRNVELFLRAAKLAVIVAVPATLIQLSVGNRFGEAVTAQQSMKIAASEAQWNTCQPCGFSLFQIGGFSAQDPNPSFSITIPDLLSWMGTGSFDGKIQGLNQLQAQEQKQYGPGNYMPRVELMYWSMRVMAVLGVVMFLIAAVGRVALSEATAGEGSLVSADGGRRDRIPVPRRDIRLDPHRDGTPALDRAGPAEDLAGRLAKRQHRDGRDQPGRVRAALSHPRRGRLHPDAPLRPHRSATGARTGRGGDRTCGGRGLRSAVR